MRISSSLFFQTGLDSINRQQADLLNLYKQAASGQRMTTPADDPLAASQTINLGQSLSLNGRLAENRQVLKQNLNAEENALTSVTLLLQDIKTRLVEAGNGTLSDADRRTLADVFIHAQDALYGLANSTDGNGNYLFSGFASSQPAFVRLPGNQVVYNGDTGQRLIQADATRQIAAADTGLNLFASAQTDSQSYISEAAVSNRGTAVAGAPVINDKTGSYVGQFFEITFSSSTTNTLQYEVSVTDYEGNILHTEGPVYYAEDTVMLSLPGGVQLAFSGLPEDGDRFTVTPAYSNEASADINLFDTLDSLIKGLSANSDHSAVGQAQFLNVLNTAMQKIDLNYNQVLTVRSSIGARLNEIEAIDANADLQRLGFRAELSRLQDIDYYEVSTQLQLRQSALEAAAMAFKRIQASSLFNMGSA